MKSIKLRQQSLGLSWPLQESQQECKLEEAENQVVNLPSVCLHRCRGNQAAQHHAPLQQGGQGDVGVWGGGGGCIEEAVRSKVRL